MWKVFENMNCVHCNKECEHNYCTWECHVNTAREAGFKVIAPNNLPIRIVKPCGDTGFLMEHEHANHTDYKFPVKIEYVGSANAFLNDNDLDYTRDEMHALIYTDGSIAVTMYEYCYATWNLSNRNGEGSLWTKGDWKMSEESRDKVKSWKRL